MEHNCEKTLKKTLFLCFALVSFGTYAQDNVVTGSVTAEDGAPLPGVNIVQKGTGNGVVADFDGNYEIKMVSGSQVLVFSYVGFSSKEISAAGQTALNVVLTEDAQNLDEVVVVGYGSQKKSDLTGSVASVKAEDIAVTPVPTFDLALQGRAPGVQITSTSGEPGGGANIRIRGSNSVLGSNEPLIVLDGYPLPQGGEASNAGSNNNRGQGSNLLGFLNPSEIESVEILKDASATAIYGSRGANGVIIVTTKKGTAGRTQVNVTTETGFNEIPNFQDLTNGPQFASLLNENQINQGNPPPFDGGDRPLPENTTTTAWLDLILRTGFNQRVQFDVSGGTEGTRYFLSGNYIKNSGILKFTDFSRANIRLNVDSKISGRLSLSTSINYTKSKNNRSEEGTGLIINSGAIFSAFKANPTAPVEQVFDDGLTNFFQNPLTQLRDQRDETYNENFILSLQAKYNLANGLDFNVRTGTTNKNSRREIYWPLTTSVGRLVNGRAIYNNYQYEDILLETYLNYDRAFGDNNLNLVGGYSFQDNTERTLETRVENFPTDILGTDAIQLGLVPFIPTSTKIKRSLASFYGRLDYNYKNKYYVKFTGRADGSSVFSANKKWGFFPSGAVGWTVSNEKFIEEGVPAISNLKFRASYGITGSQSIPPYGSLTLLGVANVAIGDALQAGLTPNKLGNPDLEWEKTSQLNVGMDFGLFTNRVYGNIDYYVKTTDDLLQSLPLPTSAGLGSIFANTGSIENKGLEVLLGAYIYDNENFSWNTSINYSNNKSTVISLGEEGADIFGPAPAVNIVNAPANIMRVGETFGALYGYKVTGLIQESDLDADGNPTIPVLGGAGVPGSWKFEDTDGDGVIAPSDRVILGNPQPDFIFGWNSDFRYKNLTLSVFVQGVVGNEVMNVDRLFLASGRTVDNNYLDWYLNRWTPENPHNDIRNPGIGNGSNRNLQPNSAIVEDGSFIRIKNVSLGYNIPTNQIDFLSSARIYVTGTNLATFSDYSGFDPEINVFGGNNIGQGVDFGSYPRSRSYTFGVQLGF